jgi:hypothetical protein
MKFLDVIMPKLNSTTEEDKLRFFAAAFVAGFTVESNEICEKVLDNLAELIINKKKRTVTFKGETIAEIIKAISLLLSILPSTVCVSETGERIQKALEIVFKSSNFEVLLEGCDLLQIMYECLQEIEYCQEENIEETKASDFAGKYKNKIERISERIDKKTDQKTLMDKVKNTLEFLNTKELIESITLKEQNIDIVGPRNIFILSAIRRVTKTKFSQMMEQNRSIHKALEFHLRSSHSIKVQKNKERKVTKRERILSQKEREIKFSSERQKKIQRLENKEF